MPRRRAVEDAAAAISFAFARRLHERHTGPLDGAVRSLGRMRAPARGPGALVLSHVDARRCGRPHFWFGAIPDSLGHYCKSLSRVRFGENYLNCSILKALFELPKLFWCSEAAAAASPMPGLVQPLHCLSSFRWPAAASWWPARMRGRSLHSLRLRRHKKKFWNPILGNYWSCNSFSSPNMF